LLALLGKRQDLELSRVLGMRPGGPVRMAKTLLQFRRLLMQLDRALKWCVTWA
jgi:hypothetical protein